MEGDHVDQPVCFDLVRYCKRPNYKDKLKSAFS